LIHALRVRHGRIFVGLAVALPVLFIAALAVRPSWPTQESSGPAPSTETWTVIGNLRGARAMIEKQSTREWLHLARTDHLVAPDVLVYWAEEAPDLDSPLPSDAVLLGAFGDVGTSTFDLPARSIGGTLILYSLGHRSLLAVQPMDTIKRIGEGP